MPGSVASGTLCIIKLSFRLLPTLQINVFQQISLPKFCKRYPNYYIKKTISVLEDSGKRQDLDTPELSICYIKSSSSSIQRNAMHCQGQLVKVIY
jgi:hypothetical protein